jgi:hypothetical protein
MEDSADWGEQQQGVQEGDQQQLEYAVQEDEPAVDQEQHQDGVDPIYAELEPRAPLPPAPVRRPRSRRGVSDPRLPTRSSGRFRGPGDEPLASLPYTGRPI